MFYAARGGVTAPPHCNLGCQVSSESSEPISWLPKGLPRDPVFAWLWSPGGWVLLTFALPFLFSSTRGKEGMGSRRSAQPLLSPSSRTPEVSSTDAHPHFSPAAEFWGSRQKGKDEHKHPSSTGFWSYMKYGLWPDPELTSLWAQSMCGALGVSSDVLVNSRELAAHAAHSLLHHPTDTPISLSYFSMLCRQSQLKSLFLFFIVVDFWAASVNFYLQEVYISYILTLSWYNRFTIINSLQ